MDYSWLIPLLALFTLLAVCIFALYNKSRVDARRHDPNAPISTLAKDGPQGGISALNPEGPRPEDKPQVRPVVE